MTTSYNIYKINPNKIEDFKEKIIKSGLKEQLSKDIENYNFTFYFSSDIKGNDIWWIETYKDFLTNTQEKPKNIFYFGLMLCIEKSSANKIYAISLGKSHFYLSKFIISNFGIDLAVKIADENTILLKKSRYFAGTKRQDVSSYQKFQKNNYEAGESVEHLKLKADDKSTWGDKNIIFADSIQLESEKKPSELPKLLNEIETYIQSSQEIIKLPKLELASNEISKKLDDRLLDLIKSYSFEVAIDEMVSHGINICFRFNDYEYKIFHSKKDEKYIKKDIGNSIDIEKIKDFINENKIISDINNIKIQFNSETNGKFSKCLKEILDIKITEDGESYFLKNGDWFKFNQSFVEYLKISLESIEIEKKEDLVEIDYLKWKEEKEKRIANNANHSEDKITYREYYFNQKLSKTSGYELLDRQLELMQSLYKDKKDYKIEVADLYKNDEIISLKISEENSSLIYNIKQSETSVELIKNNQIDFNKSLKSAAIWFVFKEEVNKITDINSIQFLLAVESWKKHITFHGLTPKIYISRHICQYSN